MDRLISGVRASGGLHLGDYLSVMRYWSKSEPDDAIFIIADLHGLVNLAGEDIDTEQYRRGRTQAIAWFLACGVDPKRSSIVFQSAIPYHLEIAFYLSALGRRAELDLLPQWREIGAADPGRPSIAAFYDPVLMASDMLLYQGKHIIVRRDQEKQVDLAAEWALRFNTRYGDLFTIPSAKMYGPDWITRDLLRPSQKMSHKSDVSGTLYLDDSNDEIRRKIVGALADGEQRIYFSREKPGISNLLLLSSDLTGVPLEQTVDENASSSYGEFKSEVADIVVSVIEPIRAKFDLYFSDEAHLKEIVSDSVHKVLPLGANTISTVRQALGID